jgi:hypothetical protein
MIDFLNILDELILFEVNSGISEKVGIIDMIIVEKIIRLGSAEIVKTIYS